MEMEERRVLRLPVAEVRPNPRQPRQIFDEEGLRELASSIARHGILQPLSVRRRGDAWELIAGERRLRAARMAGLETVPCIETAVNEDESALLALVENLQRQDLHYFEEASAIADYLQRAGCTQEEAAKRLGRSPSALANKLRLLRLSPECQRELMEGELTERHARALLRLSDEKDQLEALHRAVKGQMNVRSLEGLIERMICERAAGRQNVRGVYRDHRMFVNAMLNTVRTLQESGVGVTSTVTERAEGVEIRVMIPCMKRQQPDLKNMPCARSDYSV